MKTPNQEIVELSMDNLEQLLQRAEAKQLNDEDYATIKALIESYAHFTKLVEDKRATIDRLRKLLFGSSSEKTSDVIKDEGKDASSTTAKDGDESTGKDDQEKEQTTQRKGHGRNGADDYRGAEKIPVPHGSLQSGDACPDCQKGKVYEVAQPGVLVRITGQAPVQATVYELQKLRCNLCGKVFTAKPPEGVSKEKYDAAAASMIAILKYGSGLPFNRLEGLQESLGIPLPASTQWDIVNPTAKRIAPAVEELIRQAAQGDVLHNDDTAVKILEFMGKRAKQAALAEDAADAAAKKDAPKRSGLFTSGIVSTHQDRKIALFFSGRQHAGENLGDVLAHRAADLGPPIQMCDALSRNLPKELETLVANCIAHGRRSFVEVADRFPEECRHVLEVLKEVYKNDGIARKRNLSPAQRLQFHQAESGPLMKEFRKWLNRQFDDRRVEPNSALGEAISYMLNHWEKLTLFLREPGAPLDNNICERILKRAILPRKNALFYKTLNGAHVGDLFMSLIHTCQLNDANPFDYLTELQPTRGGTCRPTRELDALELPERIECVKRKHYHGRMSKRTSKKAIGSPKRTDPAPWLRKALAKRRKDELIDILVTIARADRVVLRRLAAHFELQTPPKELLAATRQAIADATAFDERDINHNFSYDYEAYRQVQRNMHRLIELKQLRPAMELSLELMDQGSYQVEGSDEGLMSEDIEACFRPVLKALHKSDLPAAKVIAWCAEMLKRDRVGVLCDQELRTLRQQLETSRSP